MDSRIKKEKFQCFPTSLEVYLLEGKSESLFEAEAESFGVLYFV